MSKEKLDSLNQFIEERVVAMEDPSYENVPRVQKVDYYIVFAVSIISFIVFFITRAIC